MYCLLAAFLFGCLAAPMQARQLLYKEPGAQPAEAISRSVDKSLDFFAFGDWGRNGADYQRQMAKQMTVQA